MHSTATPPERRFFRHLSLYSGDEYTNGLSIFVSTNGIVGIEAHSPRLRIFLDTVSAVSFTFRSAQENG
jgi:hypothetical protein